MNNSYKNIFIRAFKIAALIVAFCFAFAIFEANAYAGTITNEDTGETYASFDEAFATVPDGGTINLSIEGEIQGRRIYVNKPITVNITGEGSDKTKLINTEYSDDLVVDDSGSYIYVRNGATVNIKGFTLENDFIWYSGSNVKGSLEDVVATVSPNIDGALVWGVGVSGGAQIDSIVNCDLAGVLGGVWIEKGDIGTIKDSKLVCKADDRYAGIYIEPGTANDLNTISSIINCEIVGWDDSPPIRKDAYTHIDLIDNCDFSFYEYALGDGIRQNATTTAPSTIGSIKNSRFLGGMSSCIYNKGGRIESIEGCVFDFVGICIANGYPDDGSSPTYHGYAAYIGKIDNCKFDAGDSIGGSIAIYNVTGTSDSYSEIGSVTNSEFHNAQFGQLWYAKTGVISNCVFDMDVEGSHGEYYDAITNIGGSIDVIEDCEIEALGFGIGTTGIGISSTEYEPAVINTINNVKVTVRGDNDFYFGFPKSSALYNAGIIKKVTNSEFEGGTAVIYNGVNIDYGGTGQIDTIENVKATGENVGILNRAVEIGSLIDVSVNTTGDQAIILETGGQIGVIDGGRFIAKEDAVYIDEDDNSSYPYGTLSYATSSLGTITGGPVFSGRINNEGQNSILVEPELETDQPTQGYARYTSDFIGPVILPLYNVGTPQRYTMSTLTEPVDGIDGVDFRYLKVDVRVQYNANSKNASGDMSGDAYQDEWISNLEAEENGFTNGDKIFEGWNTEPDGSGIAYAPGQKIDISRASMTLYAQWADPTHTASFDSDGGTKVDSQTVVHKAKAKEPKPPTRENYTFIAWLLNGERYNFDTPVTKDITLKAQWERNPTAPATPMHIITYDLNGGTLYGETGIIEVQYDEGTTIQLPKPEKEGCTFDFWEGSRYEAGDDYTIMGDHTFTAHWIKEETRFEEETEFQDEDENCEEEDEEEPEVAEPGDSDDTPTDKSTPKDQDKPTDKETSEKKAVETSDDTNIIIWLGLFISTLALLLGTCRTCWLESHRNTK